MIAYSCGNAFSIISHDRDEWEVECQSVREFDRHWLQRGADCPVVEETFLSALESSQTFVAHFTKLIQEWRIPLNMNFKDCKCLCIATKRAQLSIVDYPLLQRPDEATLHAAFMNIFDGNAEEQTSITLVRKYFACSSSCKTTYFGRNEIIDDPLYQTLHRHAGKPALLQELLENGCRSNSRLLWKFTGAHEAEKTSLLPWLLCLGKEDIEIRIVDMLLDRGGM